MIYGIGTDITEVRRFKKWIENPSLLERFYNPSEIMTGGSEKAKLEHYAVRFAAKEAFAKALGTGIMGYDLKDVYITKDTEGKPFINVTGKAEKILNERCGNCIVHVSLSHEKEYATAFVVIERL
ncbi:MAG: holo-ACP synthase [Treponema sp.]|nr:holo-ACP synthase [Treponema sp.]